MQAGADLIERHARPVPRYTSYPTANHFTPSVSRAEYAAWLGGLQTEASLSLYVHIPFCETLCHYCACTTKATRRYEPVARYMAALLAEIEAVARRAPGKPAVTHVHLGGGSPSILAADDINRLAGALRSAFVVASEAEIAVEIDPRNIAPEKVHAFAAAGVSRVSLGVQDFEPAVQAAIGRLQSVALTERAIGLFRGEGVRSVNVDLVYGLPRQTLESLGRTLDEVIRIAPDRIAAFGYAHLPQRVRPQRLIDATALPGPHERFAQAALIAERLGTAGYRRLGLDHFARGEDGLAARPLRRNFQGYTSDCADVLIGLGASAIGKLPQGYVQNAVATAEYERLVHAHGIATARGSRLDDDDRARAFAIERLMCDFRLPRRDLVGRFGAAAGPVLAIAAEFAGRDEDGLVAATEDGLEVTERGRPFVRSICAAFDRYLVQQAGRHASGV